MSRASAFLLSGLLVLVGASAKAAEPFNWNGVTRAALERLGAAFRDLRAAIVCYRAKCRKLNVLRVRSSSGEGDRIPQPPPR